METGLESRKSSLCLGCFSQHGQPLALPSPILPPSSSFSEDHVPQAGLTTPTLKSLPSPAITVCLVSKLATLSSLLLTSPLFLLNSPSSSSHTRPGSSEREVQNERIRDAVSQEPKDCLLGAGQCPGCTHLSFLEALASGAGLRKRATEGGSPGILGLEVVLCRKLLLGRPRGGLRDHPGGSPQERAAMMKQSVWNLRC